MCNNSTNNIVNYYNIICSNKEYHSYVLFLLKQKKYIVQI